MASQSLYLAQGKGLAVQPMAMNRVDVSTKLSAAAPPPPAAMPASTAGRVAAGAGVGVGAGYGVDVTSAPVMAAPKSAAAEVSAVSAGVSLYKRSPGRT